MPQHENYLPINLPYIKKVAIPGAIRIKKYWFDGKVIVHQLYIYYYPHPNAPEDAMVTKIDWESKEVQGVEKDVAIAFLPTLESMGRVILKMFQEEQCQQETT